MDVLIAKWMTVAGIANSISCSRILYEAHIWQELAEVKLKSSDESMFQGKRCIV